MKEWFKMRTVWGASILRMTAEEAGRLIKAVYLYERTGERQVLPGPEGILYAMIEEVLVRDDEEMAALSEKRAATGAGAEGGPGQSAQRRMKRSDRKQTEAKKAIAFNKNKNTAYK